VVRGLTDTNCNPRLTWTDPDQRIRPDQSVEPPVRIEPTTDRTDDLLITRRPYHAYYDVYQRQQFQLSHLGCNRGTVRLEYAHV
jgi:hypothetical protein